MLQLVNKVPLLEAYALTLVKACSKSVKLTLLSLIEPNEHMHLIAHLYRAQPRELLRLAFNCPCHRILSSQQLLYPYGVP